MKTKIKTLAKTIEKQTLEMLKHKGLDCPANQLNNQVAIKGGLKYTKINLGDSGRLMVENATGMIYGIKGYGKINKARNYGTLETINNWFWGEYSPVLKKV